MRPCMHYRTRVLTGFLAVALALALFLSSLATIVPPKASASVESNINRLTEWQKDYLRVIRSLALKDSYDSGVFASISAGQALYEGGWAQYAISVIANNQYGIKAYSNWKGKVFDNGTYTLYDSYADYVRIYGSAYARKASLWRAYDSWEESVTDHSALFHDEAKYAPVLAAADYKEAASAIVHAGYTSNLGYISALIKVIEDYGLDELDNVTTDVNGVFGMVMDRARVVLPVGDRTQLVATAYPEPVILTTQTEDSESSESNESNAGEETSDESSAEPIPFEVVWASNAPSVATVDQNGNVTTHAQGIALITATYNGKEAACLICVGTNAFVIDGDVAVYAEPDSDSNTLGKIHRGMPIYVPAGRAYTSPDGELFYKVTGNIATGGIRTGYVSAKRVYLTTHGVTVLNTKTELHLEQNVQYQVEVEIAPSDAADKTLTWKSSDTSVATVNGNGVISTKNRGTAVITVTAASGVSLGITVYVGETITYLGVTTSNLYVRTAPSTDASSLGLIAEGTQITLYGEPQGGWYEVEARCTNGKTVRGYSSATYIELVNDPKPPVVDDPPVAGQRSGVVAVNDGSSLNIRETAGTSGKKLVSVDNGTALTILGDDIYLESERTYKVWYHVQVQLDDKLYDGYTAADFVKILQTEDPPQPSGYTVTDTLVYGVEIGTTCAQFCEKIGTTVRVKTAKGEVRAASTRMATGDKVEFLIGSTVVRTRTVAVRGDLDGDGKLGARDYMMLKGAVLNIVQLSAAQEQAGKILGNDRFSARDYMMLKMVVLGMGSL